MDLKAFIAGGFQNAEQYGVFPKSINQVNDTTVFMAKVDGKEVLVTVGANLFNGEDKGGYYVAEKNHENACTLRKLFSFTAPIPPLKAKRSVGIGDRLGIACPGHIRVFEEYDATPVFAQQSIRELNLTNRTYEDVLDCVSFYVFRDGFKSGFGADGDHLKKAEEVTYALSLGYSMITLDCSEHIRNDVDGLSDAEVEAQYVPDKALEDYYLGQKFDIGEGIVLEFDRAALMRIVLIYGEAIKFATGIYNQFFKDGKYNADFEISIDETATPTSPLQHFFAANELIRNGVSFQTMAPRFCGEFQKGIDYIGNLDQFKSEMVVHAVIARHFGYKISVHSGSDKFSVFPTVGEETRQNYHVKTAGTNWLEAMRIVAMRDAKLYREVHAYALVAFAEASTYYHVTTDLTKIPDLAVLTDAELPELFNMNDARQLIHITYGLILTHKNADGSYAFKDRLYDLWDKYADDYAEALQKHIGHHLADLGCPKRA